MILTIIVPVYNVEQYVEKCIESVLMQLTTECELLVVDDGSLDASISKVEVLLHKYKTTNCRIIRQENKGLGGARNTGINHAKGEYVLFLDSDDYIDQNAVDIILTNLSRHKNIDIIKYNVSNVYENGTMGEVWFRITDNEYITNKQFLIEEASACNKVIRKNLFIENNIYFPEKKAYEDLGTIPMLAAYTNSILKIDNILYYYLQRKNSIIHSKFNEKKFKDSTDMLERIIEFYTSEGLLNTYLHEIEFISVEHGLFQNYIRMICQGYNHKIYQESVKFIVKYFPAYEESSYVLEKAKQNILYSSIVLQKNGIFYNYVLYYFLRLKEKIIECKNQRMFE